MSKWLISIYVGVDGMDKMNDPTITYLPRQIFDKLAVGSFLRARCGDRKIRKIVEAPFGKPWHKLLTCESI